MDKKNYSRSNDVKEKDHNRQARDIGRNQKKQHQRTKVIQALEKDNGLTWEEDGIVYMEERMYVPNSKKLKEKIL